MREIQTLTYEERVRASNFQLYEEQVRANVPLKQKEPLDPMQMGGIECIHLPVSDGKYQIGYVRLQTPHPTFGEQVRQFAMCPECYQKLRDLKMAPLMGKWEAKSPSDIIANY